MNYLENPYEELARTHQDPALATLALAYEIAEIRRVLDPYDDRREKSSS